MQVFEVEHGPMGSVWCNILVPSKGDMASHGSVVFQCFYACPKALEIGWKV